MEQKQGKSFNMNKGKSGQVTIFILIGLVLLISVAAVMYISQESMLFRSSKFLPGDVKPAAEYVEQCMEEISRDAIRIAGMQGGYVYLPAYIENNPLTHIDRAGIKIPYWYYEGRDISPSIEQIEQDFGKYVDENIDICLKNLEPFEDEFDISIESEPLTAVVLGKEDITIEMNYHIVLRDGLNKTKLDIEDFKIIVPVSLKKMYEFGKQILDQENKQMFFEQVTVDLMGMNSGIPFTGLNFKCLGGPMQWKVSDVNNEIRNSLKSEISKIRVKNSDYIPFLADESVYEDLREYDVDDIAEGNVPDNVPEDSYEYFHYLFDIKYKTEDLKVGFNYLPEYGSILKVRPSSNGIMKSNVAKGSQLLSFLCLHIYQFSYDLNYPIEVMIRDDDTDNGNGFVLRYAMPVMIDHNLPNREKATQSIFEYQQQNYDYQEQCDYLSGNYAIIARGYDDYLYESELEGVSLFYDCAKYECLLGNTSFESGMSYNLETGLPGCNGGFIHAVKPGYLDTSKQVLMEDKESGVIEFWMPKLKEYNFSIVTLDYNSANGVFGAEEYYNGSASIHLVLDGVYEEIKVYPEDNKISLLVEPAKTYTLEIMLIGDDEELIGGYSGNWTISYNEQNDYDKIVFKAMQYIPKPETDDELVNMYLELFEENHEEALRPRLE